MSRHKVKMPSVLPVETVLDVMREGDQIQLWANRYRGESLLSSTQVATLSVAQADALVKELSAAIHAEPA